jgi:hypothetical protein
MYRQGATLVVFNVFKPNWFLDLFSIRFDIKTKHFVLFFPRYDLRENKILLYQKGNNKTKMKWKNFLSQIKIKRIFFDNKKARR